MAIDCLGPVSVDFAKRLRLVRARIERASELADRSPAGVTLITVTKTVSIDAIREAYDRGLRDFGESRLQEAEPKIAALPSDIRWHFVGRMQSNKAKKIASLFRIVHSLDRVSQLEAISKAEVQVEGLIEVNIAEETQKSGISPKTLDAYRRTVLQCAHVQLRGLMTVGPNYRDPEAMRPFFKRLKRLGDEIGGEWLSMGMSGDFDVAIQEGATHIRVGSALFGERI